MLFSSFNRSRKGVVQQCRKAYYNLNKWKARHDEVEKLYNAQWRRAARLEALLANDGVAPAGDTSVSMEDLPPTGLCAAPSPRHRRHAKAALEAHGVTVASKVTMKMATAQACLTAALKGQKRSTQVELYKEACQSAKKGQPTTSLSKSLQIDRRTLLHPRMAKGKTAPKIASSSWTSGCPARDSSPCSFRRCRPSPNMFSGPGCSTTQCAPSGSPSSPAK